MQCNGKAAGWLFLLLASGNAQALSWQYGSLDISWNNRVSAGLAVRVEQRDPALIGKLNLDPGLCDEHDCLPLDGDTSIIDDFIAAPGAFFGHAGDDGNMNYDQGDLTAGLVSLNSELRLNWNDFSFKAKALAFHDFVNYEFEETHFNTRHQPAGTRRDGRINDLVGQAVELQEAFLLGSFYFGNQMLVASVGKQKIRWGEANFVALNNLNIWSPLDARRLFQPGSELGEANQAVPAVLLSLEITPNLTAETVYQWQWQEMRVPPAGSFMSFNDLLYRENSTIPTGLGQFPEDPDGLHRLQNPLAALVTSTSTVNQFRPDNTPRDGGEYGLRLNWFAENINNGTEFSFYAANYHSRLPSASAYAADESCLRDAPVGTIIDAALACQGFNSEVLPVNGGEPIPLETVEPVMEYPEDIHLLGLSFSTNFGAWAISGEYAFRPNLPLQVAAVDALYGALQPALPENDIIVGDPTGLLGPTITIPGANNAVPSYLAAWRGVPIEANDYVRGWERMAVHQASVTGLRLIGNSNWLGADSIIFMTELGATWVPELNSMGMVRFDAGSAQNTHHGPGADGSGTEDGEYDTRLINPTQMTEGLATPLSMGLRAMMMVQYAGLPGGFVVKPINAVFIDFHGNSPLPAANFREKTVQFISGLEFSQGSAWSGKLMYFGFLGDAHNPLRDRDHVMFDISYSF